MGAIWNVISIDKQCSVHVVRVRSRIEATVFLIICVSKYTFISVLMCRWWRQYYVADCCCMETPLAASTFQHQSVLLDGNDKRIFRVYCHGKSENGESFWGWRFYLYQDISTVQWFPYIEMLEWAKNKESERGTNEEEIETKRQNENARKHINIYSHSTVLQCLIREICKLKMIMANKRWNVVIVGDVWIYIFFHSFQANHKLKAQVFLAF